MPFRLSQFVHPPSLCQTFYLAPVFLPLSPHPFLGPDLVLSLFSFALCTPKDEKQGHMRGDSEQNCAPDVPAEAVERLPAGRAHFSHAQDMWTVGERCSAQQHGGSFSGWV